MALNFSNLFPQADTHVDATFVLDEQTYDIEHFGIRFSQTVDHKGQPQHEAQGGKLTIVLSQSIGNTIYDWGKRTKRKDGKVLFQSKSEGTVLEILFQDAYCVNLTRSVDMFSGTKTTLVISPRRVTLNGIAHDNHWRD